MSPSDHIDRLVEKINLLPTIPDSDVEVAWGSPATVDALDALEAALGVTLPYSFCLFQMKTGGGGIDGLAISTVSSSNFLGGSGTVYGDTQFYRENALRKLPKHLVVVQRDLDDNEPFCLDTSNMLGGECPVVLYYHQSTGHIEKIADNFVDFYQKYLEPYFDEAGI